MPRNPLESIAKADPGLFAHVNETREFAFAPGALDTKTKQLIALALDASLGAANGVRSLADGALQNGATKDEIMEALRVAAFITGAHCVYSAAAGLDGLFDGDA